MTLHKNKASDAKQLPCPIKDWEVIISPVKIKYHRKVTLKDTDINEDTRTQLQTLHINYTDIFSKHNGYREN